ncbi:hypothetical protein IV102_13490 [bacterium]|nr:hypothetical protein [bacterium]
MISVNAGLRGPMTQFIKSGDLGPGSKADTPFLGEFGTLMLATESVRPLFSADQMDGVDLNAAVGQVEVDAKALQSNPELEGYKDCSRVRCDFVGPKEDPDQVTIHTQSSRGEDLIMASYNGQPDGSAVIRYVQASGGADQLGWVVMGHELTLKPGDSPFDVQCKSQTMVIDLRPTMAD